MSGAYADGLSPYAHKGVLGAAEKFDSDEKVREKCLLLTQLIKDAKHVVVHTGAGISTSAGIPDFRGPNGVWTLEEKGLKPDMSTSFHDAEPTFTHMALKKLAEENLVKFIISQNIDGLHLKSGLPRKCLAELHGNMFIEQCNVCKRQFIRSTPAPTVGQKYLGKQCYSGSTSRRPCRGKLQDIILDWEHSLPDDDLDIADMHSSIADLSICLGTTLQIIPSGNIPLNTIKYGGKMVICNLQPTKHDNKADLVINTFVDDIFRHVMKNLGIELPKYDRKEDPIFAEGIQEWTICKKMLLELKKTYKKQCDGVVKKRILVKSNKDVQKQNFKMKKCKVELIDILNTNPNTESDSKNTIPIIDVNEDKAMPLLECKIKKEDDKNVTDELLNEEKISNLSTDVILNEKQAIEVS